MNEVASPGDGPGMGTLDHYCKIGYRVSRWGGHTDVDDLRTQDGGHENGDGEPEVPGPTLVTVRGGGRALNGYLPGPSDLWSNPTPFFF